MTQLVIHLPGSTITFETDDFESLNTLSDFCKEDLDAYYATENENELTVDYMDEEMNDKFHSLIFKLGLE